jgi:ABC-type multidrug transport system fused ATPase/permease subunit
VDAPKPEAVQKKQEDKKTIIEEERQIGTVPFGTYIQYWKAGGLGFFVLIVLLYVLVQLIYVAIPFWIGIWVQADDQTDGYYIGICAALAIGLVLGSLIRCTVYQYYLLSCNKNLHFQMLEAVSRSPVTFFDSNPSGRVMTRFSKDTAICDTMLKFCMMDLVQLTCVCLGNVIVMAILNYVQVGPSLVIVLIAYLLFRWIIPYSREVRRFELASKGPIYSEYASNLSGISTIRAYNYSPWLQRKMNDYLVLNIKCLFTFHCILRCYMTYIDFIVTVLLLSNGLTLVAMRDSMSPEEAGFSLSFTTSFCVAVVWLAK